MQLVSTICRCGLVQRLNFVHTDTSIVVTPSHCIFCNAPLFRTGTSFKIIDLKKEAPPKVTLPGTEIDHLAHTIGQRILVALATESEVILKIGHSR
jgi:hypothetical protein